MTRALIELLKNPLWVEAIAKLAGAVLWPFITLCFGLLFKGEISSIFRRLKKGKLLGNELELGTELDAFARTTEIAQAEIYIPPSAPEGGPPTAPQIERSDSDIEKIVALAGDSPELGFIMLARKIEKEMKLLMAVGGHLKGKRMLAFQDMAEYLAKNAAVSENLKSSLNLFWDVRNKIVHAQGEIKVTREEVIRAVDIGLTVLSAIKAIPHELHVVAHPNVDLFQDQAGTVPVPGVKGLMLEATSPGRATKALRIYPTTKTWYRPGMAVTWEWNMGLVTGRCFYRDPTDGTIKSAWSSAAEFVGRDLDAI